MKKCIPFVILVAFAFACKKDNEPSSSAINVANISGTYKVVGLVWKIGDDSEDKFSQFPECEKDNLTTLHTNMTATLTDAGIICDPLADDTGSWSLSGTTITINGSVGEITSFDGKTLIITGAGFGIVTTTTAIKQ